MRKKLISAITGCSMMITALGVSLPVKAGAKFDPETVMWTNNIIDRVAYEDGIYSNFAAVDPNAGSSTETKIQTPYGNSGETLKGWAYSEYLWTHSYPVGNGRMGAMVAGAIDKEVIQINEDTIWSGSPYAELEDQDGNIIATATSTNSSAISAAETITGVNATSGSTPEAWKYYRGSDADGNPAEIGSDNVYVGDEAFRESFPEFANTSISKLALGIDNSKTQEAVQYRYGMERLVEYSFLGNPSSQKVFKSFVEMYLDFGQSFMETDNYIKSLDMEKGIVTVDYDYEDAHFTRETFASYPDQAVVTHITSDKALDFTAELHTYHTKKAGYYSFEKVSDNEIKLTAQITDGSKSNQPGGPNVIRFEARMIVDAPAATTTVSSDNTTVTISGGNEATIYIIGASNYVNYMYLDNSKPETDCERYKKNLAKRSYEDIKERHIEDFGGQFNKTSLSISNTNGVDESNTPTEKRIRKDVKGVSGFEFGGGNKLSAANSNGVYTTYADGDNKLAVLDFNYGKYLLISGSRDSREADGDNIAIQMSQPLNLAGKWNGSLSASWGGKYTININTEMNYWPAQPLNLADCEKPLLDVFGDLAASGAITAYNQYAIGDGSYQDGDPWVMHHNFDLWRGTMPIDNATAGLWPTGGVWLLDHGWNYYLYNNDKEYLKELYPYLKGAASFFTEFLVIDPETGYLITAASCSPEQGGVQPGPAMDTQLIRNLYDTVVKAADILGKTDEDSELISKINEQMPSDYFADENGKLAPNLIDDSGLIKEWVRGDVTFDISSGATWSVINPFTLATESVYAHAASNNSTHRHCSHLWEMFPGKHLSAYSDDENEQEIFEAFSDSVDARSTGSGQGWGVAWRINLNARALNGEMASSLIEQLLTTRTSPNLFDQHPNFQIDGNYGLTSGIIEMLFQSHDGTINILPAIPDKWETGRFTGFKAVGGAIVDAEWINSVPAQIKVTAAKDGELRIRNDFLANANVCDSNGNVVEASKEDDGTVIVFEAENGKTYTISNFSNSDDEFEYKINSATADGEDIRVSLTKVGTSDAMLVAAGYDSEGKLLKTESVAIANGGVTVFEGFGDSDMTVKLFVWDGMDAIKPLGVALETEYTYPTEPPAAEATPEPTIAPTPTPEPTPDPNMSNEWIASSSDSTLISGTAVMRGLTLLFDVTSSNKTFATIDDKSFAYYISSANNGKWSSGAATGTAFKYVATENGTFTIYCCDLGSGKELCITKEGTSANKTNVDKTSAYYYNDTGSKCNKSLSLEVEAGNTYYAYVAGSKGRFVGALFEEN